VVDYDATKYVEYVVCYDVEYVVYYDVAHKLSIRQSWRTTIASVRGMYFHYYDVLYGSLSCC
jgi:hypothetical protein